MFDYTVETNQSIEEAIVSMETSLEEDQFGVLWHLDIQDKLREKGLDFDQPYRILEVCNPKEAQRVLSQNQMVGYFLPCKIVIYDNNGKTKIGMPRPTTLIGLTSDESLKEIAEDVENRLITCIDKSK